MQPSYQAGSRCPRLSHCRRASGSRPPRGREGVLEAALSRADAEVRQHGHGYNEVAGTKVHPVRAFLGKFRGVSAWMLELIMVLSAVPGKYADLAVVSALPGVVVVLSLVRGAPLLAADAPAGIRLARVGLPGLAPLPWSQTLAILVDALVSSLLVNDTAKVFLIRWRVPWAVA